MRTCIGPDELPVVVRYTIHPGERLTRDYPGSPAWVEVLDADAVVTGGTRRLTDEEYAWLEEAEDEIEREAFAAEE